VCCPDVGVKALAGFFKIFTGSSLDSRGQVEFVAALLFAKTLRRI
jgi:hypothetical protein